MAEETLPLGVSSCLVPLDIQPTALEGGRGGEEEGPREPGQAEEGRRGERGGRGGLHLKQLLETSWLCVSDPAEAPRTSNPKKTAEGALGHL